MVKMSLKDSHDDIKKAFNLFKDSNKVENKHLDRKLLALIL